MAEQNFSAALTTWKEINLSDLQKSLDSTALELVENQKENMVGRKKLAEQTREFKKQPDDAEKFNAIKVLLKAYQGEIDSLTRRSKMSETAFLNVYKLLSDAPDPYPLLDAAVDQTVKVAEARMLESELTRLREENTELKKQVGDMGNVEEKRRKAETKVDQLEERMDELIQERVTQKENELNAEYDERMRNYEEREKDLQRQVATVKGQLRDLHASNESTQAILLNASERQDQDVAARLAEIDMVAADLVRANERVATVERRNELLRSEIESVRSGSGQAERVKALEGQISELEAEASRLLRALDSLKEAKAEGERAEKKRADDAAREIASQAAEIDSLKTRVKQYADYDEIKRELEIMKYVEFSGADFEGDDDVRLPDPNANEANKQLGRSLENLLVSKNRRLLEDLTKLRVSWDELSTQHASAEDTIENLQRDLSKQRSLVEKLENDLASLHKTDGEARGGTPGAQTPAQSLAGLDIGGKVDGRASPATFATNGDTSILPIVTSQRDRFRQRNAELEEELRKQFESISDLRSEIKSLQADNLKLYEKVRYMQSYRDPGPSAVGPSSGGAGLLNGVMSNRSREDEIGKYKDKYDESLNPFEAFKGREAQRAIQALNPLERAVFALTRAVIGNKRARSLFILYAGSLHVLILFILWNSMAASDSSSHPPLTIKPIQ
ncbi:putative Golgi vesicle transport-related protein [Naematelia encephala]|uniref:Protein CASP n=1 Tax=Naematelia encephala TaxID=71784 RepID=A0A1Y2BHB1_9TREE|nr:putative Golgi vesicle transport-related protein [Naematelia encephala]